jgi:hypothetical protein
MQIRSASNDENSIVMDIAFDETALETIDLLEARLKRIQYAVCGYIGEAASNNENATKRLADIEDSLHKLAAKSRIIQDLLNLRE